MQMSVGEFPSRLSRELTCLACAREDTATAVLVIIHDHLRRRAAHFDLVADSFDFCVLLVNTRDECLNPVLEFSDRHFLFANLTVLFIDLCMFFKELIE